MLSYFYKPCNPDFQGGFFFPQSPVQIHLLRDSQHVPNGAGWGGNIAQLSASRLTAFTWVGTLSIID